MLTSQASQLRVALALVLLEHKPVSVSLPDYLAQLRARVVEKRGGMSSSPAARSAASTGPTSKAGEDVLGRRKESSDHTKQARGDVDAGELQTRQGGERREAPDVIEEPTLSDLQHATTILSPATAAALAALLASLPTSNHSRPSQFPFLTITLSHASRSTTNLPVPDLLRGFFELVTALSSEVQQEFGRPDLQELEIRAQATVGSLELLVPWLSRWTNQLIVVMQRERSEARVETGQMAARDEEERDSTMEMVDLEGAMTNLLHSLTHFALSFSPSSSSSPQTRLFDLVHKASALSPSLSNALLSLMLGDLHNILSAHLTPLLTPNLPSPQPSLPPAYLNLDRLPHLLNLLLSLTTLALQTPIASSMDTLGPAVDRLTLLLGSFGIDDLLGPELEGACLSVLEGVWTLLERENAGQVGEGVILEVTAAEVN